MDKRQSVLNVTIEAGEFKRQVSHCRQHFPNEEFVVVVCDLDDEFGRAVATWDNAYVQGDRASADVWVFSFPLAAWQSRRRKLVGQEDWFENLGRGAARFVVVSGKTPLIGTCLMVATSSEGLLV